LKVYRAGAKKSQTAINFLSSQFPGMLIYSASTDDFMAWATPAEHETIASLLETFAEAYPDPVVKAYYFKYTTLTQGHSYLSQISASADTIMTPRSSGDLLVSAVPEVHERIAASIAEFDVPRPAGTEKISKNYDISDIPDGWRYTVMAAISSALDYRVTASIGLPGQIIVWGKPADLEKVDKMVEDIRTERYEATSFAHVYTLHRGTNVQNVVNALPAVAPNGRYTPGTNPNQVVIWAREADHLKIAALVETLNESEPDIRVELHSLRGVYYITASNVINHVILERGLDARIYPESYGNRLVVLARPEDQTLIADILENLRAEERVMLHVALRNNDPTAVETAIDTMYYDEPLYAQPIVKTDENTNMVFIYAMPKYLVEIAKLLRDMGEDVWYPAKPDAQYPVGPGGVRQKENVRVIELRGTTLKDLEKLWKQSQPNPLKVIKEKEETPSFYSLENEIQREDSSAGASTDQQEDAAAVFTGGSSSASPIYVVVKEDGSLSIASEDTVALDRLERLLKQHSTGILHEGRDYTIFAVRNISANVVFQRLQIPLREKLNPATARFSGTSARTTTPLYISQPDVVSNSITVWGTKADRLEVGKLIALFDVSELPGERSIQKPISVQIHNVEAQRVLNDVLKVYLTKMTMTRLPVGVTPQIIANDTKNSLEIFAPEPLATELKEYIEEVDRNAQAEPGRKLVVIPLKVKSEIFTSSFNRMAPFMNDPRNQFYMQGGGYGMPPYNYNRMPPFPFGGGMRW
jgi:hypothetical protein